MADSGAWDDTDLVSEWNRMKEEYKKYHSLAAQGIRVAPEELTMDFDEDQTANATGESSSTTHTSHTEQVPATQQQDFLPNSAASMPAPDPGHATSSSNPSMTAPVPVPDGMDEDTKKLVMSWYFAGYYTGRFEGKQQALADIRAGSIR